MYPRATPFRFLNTPLGPPPDRNQLTDSWVSAHANIVVAMVQRLGWGQGLEGSGEWTEVANGIQGPSPGLGMGLRS